MNASTNDRAAVVRAAAESLDLADLTKRDLVDLCRRVFGTVGDSARTAKETFLARLLTADREKVVAGIVAMVDDGTLNFDDAAAEEEAAGDDDSARAEAAEAVQRAAARPPRRAAAASAAAEDDVDEVARQLALLLKRPAGAAPLDEERVLEIAREAAGHAAEDTLAKVNGILAAAIESAIANIPPRVLVIQRDGVETSIEGRQHKQFDELLRVVSARDPAGYGLQIWLAGMPGTGKTTAARNVAKALEAPFYCNGSVANKYELTGFVDAHGKLVRTPFREAWENGGVYLFDEIDGSAANALVAFNAALANGVMAFPDGMLERHKDCIIIAAANTNGLGATAEMVGRVKLDAAFLDRFVFIEWAIDEAMELDLCPRAEWAAEVQRLRKNAAAKGLKVFITPRATIYGASLLDAGVPLERVKQMALRKGMTDQQWQMLTAA